MQAPTFIIPEFDIQESSIPSGHRCVTEEGFSFAQIRIIVGGSCEIEPKGDVLQPGSILYLPPQKGYDILWNADSSLYILSIPQLVFPHATDEIRIFKKDTILSLCKELLEYSKEGKTYLSLSVFYKILSEIETELVVSDEKSYRMVEPAIKYLNEHYLEEVQVQKLAQLCYISESRFFSLFKKETGMSPIAYRNSIKIKAAIFLLREGFSVEQITERLRFCSPAFFRRQFKKITGTTPSRYK